MNSIDQINNEIIIRITKKFPSEKYDIGNFKQFSYPKLLPIMKYEASKYKVIGLGNMAILKCKTLNLMNLLTIVLTPDLSKNIPFVIIDFVCIKNKCISFFEFFDGHTNNDEIIKQFKDDALGIKAKYAFLEDYIEKPNWYILLRSKYSLLKHGKKANYDKIITMLLECLDAYLLFVSNAKAPEAAEFSKEKLTNFINDMINKGNPSTKPITKALGNAKAEVFFKNIVFYRAEDN